MSVAQTQDRAARAPQPGWAAARLRRFEPATLVWIAAVLALVFLVVSPVARLVVSSLQSTETGAFTLRNYVIAYGRVRDLEALGNTLLYAVEVMVLSAVFAVPIAWGVARTDMPGKSFVRAMILGAFITPPYLGAIGWILLGGPNAGWINKVWMAVTGAQSGFINIFSFGGLVFVTALYAFPYIFVFTADALELVSSEMEEAANILGSGALRTIWKVTLPLVTPAIIGGCIVVFLDAVALFGTPAIIALPARIKIMTLQLWQFFEFPVRAEAAAAYAVPLVLITVALFAVQRLILGRRGYVALTGKGGSRRLMELGGARWLMFGYAFLVVALAIFLPYAALAQAAFSRAWGRGFSWDNFTLGNFGALLGEANARATILHSFTYSAATACVGVALALLVAYIVSRKLVRGGIVLLRALHGAAGHSRHRARDRHLRGLVAAADRALRHRDDHGARLHHALPADRVHQLPGGAAFAQPGDGGSGAHPRRQGACSRSPGSSCRCSRKA